MTDSRKLADVVTTSRVTTDQLHAGDVVLHYGMLLQVGDVVTFPAGSDVGRLVDVFGSVSRVLNLEETRSADVVPRAWTADGTWWVQGNSLHSWSLVTFDASALVTS